MLPPSAASYCTTFGFESVNAPLIDDELAYEDGEKQPLYDTASPSRPAIATRLISATLMGAMKLFITLFATVCLAGADPQVTKNACVNEVVVDQNLAPDMTMSSCMGIEGLESARNFVEGSPLYSDEKKWKLNGWSCQFGNKPRPKDHEA